ncbi:hypothetical protein AB0O68_35040 [Streptomyces sp. NPDC087512]
MTSPAGRVAGNINGGLHHDVRPYERDVQDASVPGSCTDYEDPRQTTCD